MISLKHFLILSGILFSVGFFGILSRRNILGILMSIELIFNAVGINFVAFNHYLYPGSLWGQGMTIFIISLAAAEAVVGMALVLVIFRNAKTVLVENMNILRG
ncbi:MAG: NADH-quinone oxidoreductase subunit NuoK [Elusimicrobia bacterium]|nr:NADH-quinone oxidoreductase subunit NuoK [Candidatus Obscuribacterium magneticum]